MSIVGAGANIRYVVSSDTGSHQQAMGLSLDWPIGDSSDEWLIVSCVVRIGGGELVPAVTMGKVREKRREGAMTKSTVPNVRYRPPEMVFPFFFFSFFILFLFIYSFFIRLSSISFPLSPLPDVVLAASPVCQKGPVC